VKRYQIFISSTYKDLKNERAAVEKAILSLRHIPVGMERFTAADESSFEYIKRLIDDTDYYVLIIGNMYGSLCKNGLSFTEREYNYAVERKIPILAFLHSNPSSLPGETTGSDSEKKLIAFRDRVMNGHLVSLQWNSIEGLTNAVIPALVNAINDKPRPGWERVSAHTNEELLGQLNSLRINNDELRNNIKVAEDNAIRKAGNLVPSMSIRLEKAQKDVIISGGSMSQIIACDDILKELANRGVKIRLLALNVENIETRNAYEKMRPYDKKISVNLDHLKTFKNDENIEIRIHDSLIALYLYAIDINEENGWIGADHFLTAVKDSDYPHIEVTRRNKEWYSVYQQQIEHLWEYSKVF